MKRRKNGVTVIEMVVGLIVVIPVILLLIDLVLINLAAQINDNAAREADRMAAAGDPAQAMSRALAVVKHINQSTSGFVSQVKLASLSFTPANLLANEAQLQNYGGIVQGSVTVQTEVTVTPLIVSYVYSKPFIFRASQTCPITYNVPNTAGGQPVDP